MSFLYRLLSRWGDAKALANSRLSERALADELGGGGMKADPVLALLWGTGVHPASAGINSVRFYACPECGAVVMDSTDPGHQETRRRAHEAWHA